MPHRCLAPDGPGPEALLVSASRFPVEEGHTFAQPSLSEFYRALRLASAPGPEGEPNDDLVWLPARAFDPSSLVASDGESVLGRLVEQCDYLIVEDADLRPQDLVRHQTDFSLRTLAAIDMTRAMRLTGNYAYVLWPRGQRAPHLEGELLW